MKISYEGVLVDIESAPCTSAGWLIGAGIFETILSNCEMQCLITRKGGRHTTLTDSPLERNTDAAIDAI